jgi:hypothetical protein
VRPCEKGMLFHTEYWERENKGWGRVGGGWSMHLEVVLHICVPTGAAAHKGLPVLEVDAVVDVAQAAEHHPDLCARQRQREWEQFRGAGQDGSGPGAKGEGRAARRVSTGPHTSQGRTWKTRGDTGQNGDGDSGGLGPIDIGAHLLLRYLDAHERQRRHELDAVHLAAAAFRCGRRSVDACQSSVVSASANGNAGL